jgi:CheY-like chemotaxis protein
MTRKVLFVDDDQVLQRVMESRLSGEGNLYSLSSANDGFDALKKLEKSYYSLVVIDLIMPRLDGMSLFSHIHEKYPDIAVIMTNEADDGRMQQLVQSTGAAGFLIKPFSADELSAMILSALQKEAAGGIMYNVSPPVFFQLMEMDTKTTTIRILDKKSQQGGILYFHEGQLIDARIGEFKGLDAAHCVFGWDDVTVMVRNDCPAMENTINSDLQAIIMKAVGLKDESEDLVFDDDDSSPGAKIQKMITREIKGIKSIEALQLDENIKVAIDALKTIAKTSGVGNLQLAHVDQVENGETVIIPGNPAAVLHVQTDAPAGQISKLLSTRLRVTPAQQSAASPKG